MIGQKISYQAVAAPALGQPVTPGSPSLGQDVGEAKEVIGLIATEFDKLPEAQVAIFQKQLDACVKILEGDSDLAILLGLKCLYDLFQDVKDAVEENKKRGEIVLTPRAPAPPAEPFPWTTVLLGLAAAGGVGTAIYFATRG